MHRWIFRTFSRTWIHENSRHEILSIASEKFDLKLANGRELLNFPREFEFTCSCALLACMRIRIFQNERIRIHVRASCMHACACMHAESFEFSKRIRIHVHVACMHARAHPIFIIKPAACQQANPCKALHALRCMR